MKFLLTLYFIFFSMTSWSQGQIPKALYPGKVDKLCVVISGKAKDYNNFLDEELFKGGQPIAGVNCHVFGNWDDAVKYTNSHLSKEGKLLIVQGAHGNNDATYNVNDGEPVSATTIFNNLKELSQNYQVGSVIHSCFSAEIMNQKLIDDEKNEPRMDKLCLVSSSSFGRVTRSNKDDIIQNLLRMQPGDNLEKPFINTRGGVISSAAWSDVGLPQFLMSKKTEEGFATLEKMDSILRGDNSCNSIGKANSAMCLAPNVSDETYQDVMSFMNPQVPDERKGFFESNVGRSAQKLRQKFEEDPKDLHSMNGAICKEQILKYYQQRFGPKLYKMQYYPEVMTIRDEILQKPFYKTNCLAYLKGVTDEHEKKTLITESFDTGIDEYINSLDRLEKKYKTKNKFNGDFDLFKFAKDAIGEKKVCSLEERKKMISSKEGIVRSLFGMEFFMDEYTSNYEATDYSPDEMIYDAAVSTQTVLKGFQNSALLKPALKNEKDIKRRKACRDFSF